jgi:hypothetical protein
MTVTLPVLRQVRAETQAAFAEALNAAPLPPETAAALAAWQREICANYAAEIQILLDRS